MGNMNLDFAEGEAKKPAGATAGSTRERIEAAGEVAGDLETAKVLQESVTMVRDVLDLDAARRRIAKHLLKLEGMVAEALAHEVTDDASRDLAIDYGAQAADLMARLEKLRKEIVEDPGKKIKAINALFKTPKDNLERIKSDQKKKIGDYAWQVELKRREKEKQIAEEQTKKQAEMDRATEAAGVGKINLPTMKVPRKQEPARTESGSASTSMEWTFEVLDLLKVPREYLVLNESHVKHMIKGGARSIEGLRIFERPKVTIRKY